MVKFISLSEFHAYATVQYFILENVQISVEIPEKVQINRTTQETVKVTLIREI